ncbi:S9 family peptidase [Sphingomonas sp. SFZ2018-12]|uniref:alpha/beta hydrolase family protein n=1 Tax=Sphingomonas sp. SFZ2018-12 TaxID=2683197 RepID=UPI001F0DCB8C|nr:S9 family peptidase [Sphingomonas sp. SFZ2018-12]
MLGTVLACAPTASFAQSTAQTLSREQAASAFGARERVLDASISPDGTRIALVSPGPEQSTVVQVLDLATNVATPVNFADGKPMTLGGCGWASDKRLLCTLYGVANYNGPLLGYQRLIALDADGKNVRSLSATERNQQYIQQSDGYVIDWRDGTSSKVLLARNYVPTKTRLNSIGSLAQGLGVDLLDTITGKVEHVESADSTVSTYLSDGTGAVRIMGNDPSLKLNFESKGKRAFFYRRPGSKQWAPFSTYDSSTDEGLYPIAVDGKANVAYALKKLDGREALYRVALDGSMKTEVAFAHPKVDVSGIVRVGRQGRIVGAQYTLDRTETHFFDAEYADLAAKLARALPRTPLIRIVDSSADERKHLVFAASDTDPGRFFFFDQDKRQLFQIADERPQLADVAISEQKSIVYPAADGTQVPGYLTLPVGVPAKNLPAIVLPHGGPAARDEWGFDWLAQFFVNRGYAVLQPNYRGSSGYGEGWFQENGFRSWKVAIGDVNDAGRWLVKQGIADPARLAIVGWSYGGYAALQSNVLAPDLFKAVVAIAPVTDLEMLRSEQTGFVNTRLLQDYIGEGPQLQEGSPTRFAAAFKAPVLLFHGDKDINVRVDEARAMERALKRAGKPVELVVYPDIAHQLADSAVRIDMLNRADAFLERTLKE